MKPALPIPFKKHLPEVVLFIGALIAISWAVYFSFATITIPYQIELREGTAQVLTKILLERGNPFVFDNQPLAMNNYGIGYNLVVLPFAGLFGNTLLVHRSVTLLFVVLSALLGFIAVYKKNESIPLALTCMAFIMIGLIGRGGIGAFPSSMGVFLLLLSVLVPFLRSFDRGSLMASALIALFAFYTKAYFVLGFGVLVSYLFLFVSKRKGIFYGLFFSTLLFVSLLVIRYIFPLYFINTLVGNISNTTLSIEHLFIQLRDLFYIFWPVMVLYVAQSTGIFLKRGFFWKIRFPRESRLDSALFESSVDYFAYVFVLLLFAFLFVLGPHVGSYLNYAYQLLTPFFFIWFFQRTAGSVRFYFTLLVLFNIFTWELNLLNPNMLRQKESGEWADVLEYLRESQVVLNSPAVASEIVADGRMPMDTGQTSYFYAVGPFPNNLLTGTSYDEFYNDGFRYMLLIDKMIEKQKFDLVITTKEKANFYHDKKLIDYYYQVDEIKVDMPQTDQHWTLVIWKSLAK